MARSDEPKKAWLFHHMASMPWPYLVILPIAFLLLIGFGWTQEDYIEDQVALIWIPTEGDYALDVNYASSLGVDNSGATSFAAMSIARDGGNLFTESRLEEIRMRMEKAEGTTIEYEGVTFTWEDVCAANSAGKGTTYEFPCVRLSPMDLFQEARWFFEENDRVTWHDTLIHDTLVAPRIPRFGIMQNSCPQECAVVMGLRLSPEFAVSQGFPPEYANPLALFADIGNMEFNDPCRACIEENYISTVQTLLPYITNSFGLMAQLTAGLLQSGAVTDPEQAQQLQTLAGQYGQIAQTTTLQDAADFLFYYTLRGLYAQLGTASYLAGYAQLSPLVGQCQALGLVCPPAEVDEVLAAQHLLAHADHDFSSVNTAGSPFPMFSDSALFAGSQPFGGSGVDMSQDLFSMAVYLDLFNAATPENWNPAFGTVFNALNLTEVVEANPVYAWFMSDFDIVQEACANEPLPGTQTGVAELDGLTGSAMAAASQSWCTPHNIPNALEAGEGPYSRQYFARMWYDLLIDSDGFLSITEGVDDPYTWTTGQGCGYVLQGERDSYTNRTDEEILAMASRELYYIDEGESVGAIDRSLLIGDTIPGILEYSAENPLQKVGVIQALYAGLLPPAIVDRVRNCNRPGGPVDITEEDAKIILKDFKKAFEDNWSEGWDDPDAGDVQFVIFTDDRGEVGTTGRLLRDITLDNGKLMAISIALIALFSIMLLISPDFIESRVLLTLAGVALVLLAFFASIGLAILIGIKVNITIAWTLPFIILGLGVDDVYIVLMALKKQNGYSEQDFLKAMKEIAVPVTMTSLVNCCLFGVLNISDVPAIYKTATVAVIAVIALYLSVILCYPAYCYLDMRRQASGRHDVCFCVKTHNERGEDVVPEHKPRDFRDVWLFDLFYKPFILGKGRVLSHTIIILGTIAMFSIGVWGITEREIGLGLEDFYPAGTQAQKWAETRTEELASWTLGMNWGALNYSDPSTQQMMIKQFEDVIATDHVAETDTKRLWMADLIIWGSRHCSDNFARDDVAEGQCGGDVLHEESGTTCEARWIRNDFGLRSKIFPDPRGACEPHEGGICRPSSQMFTEDLELAGWDPVLDNETIWCPVVDWQEDGKFLHCLTQWRNITGFSGGGFVKEEDHGSPTECEGEYNRDEALTFPIPYSSGPTLFAFDLFSHDLTLDLLEQTRDVCDDHPELRCWMSGIPYDYWTQYEGIFPVLVELSLTAAAVGFGIAWLFLFVKLFLEKRHGFSKVLIGSLIGAALITTTILVSQVIVIGLSILWGVNLTGFSNMAFVLSVGFAVEYSVHVVARWLRAPNTISNSLDRVDYTMSFLMLPTFMSWVSSTIGVVCLAFTDFEFNKVFFFRPLMIVMMVTYFIGCYSLPVLLSYIDMDVVRLGKTAGAAESMYVTKSIAAGTHKDLVEAESSDEPDKPSEEDPQEDAEKAADAVEEAAAADEDADVEDDKEV